jgi:hypothetical protein
LIVYGQPVHDFVARTVPGCERGFGECQAIGFADNGVIVAGVVYHNWSPETGVIEMSAGSITRNWLNRARLSLIFGYPFDVVRCRMAIARIAESNHRARRIWRSLGADEFIIPALRSPTEAECIFTLPRETWEAGRFKGAIRGQAESANAA